MRTSRLYATVCAVGALASVCAPSSSFAAQAPAGPKVDFPAPSPASTLKQRVGLTDVEITYSRPSMKGRKIFGGLVPYGRIWRTGANTATKISFSTAVTLNGTAVPAGTYELFTIPEENEWTVIIHQHKSQWGSYSYDAKNDVARLKARPVALAAPVESLALGLNDLRDSSATLYLAWENIRVPIKLEVDTVGLLRPQIEAAMKAEGKKPYFQAAMFYFENNLDLRQALAWMEAGLAEQPEAFWMLYRKGLILAKLGDKAAARAAAQQSIALAAKRPGEIKDEYTRLNEALLASLR